MNGGATGSVKLEPEGLAARLEAWMAAHRDQLDELMRAEGSRALHEEFILAEGGGLPDAAARVERARAASMRAWLRHLARALGVQINDPGLVSRLERKFVMERLEQLTMEEVTETERRGRGAPDADARREQLQAWARLFAEGLGGDVLVGVTGPEAGRRLSEWWRAHAGEVTEVAGRAEAAWSVPSGEAQDGNPFGRVSEHARVQEAALVWAHVRVLADGIEALARRNADRP